VKITKADTWHRHLTALGAGKDDDVRPDHPAPTPQNSHTPFTERVIAVRPLYLYNTLLVSSRLDSELVKNTVNSATEVTYKLVQYTNSTNG